MLMECMLILHIICLVVLGLDLLPESGNSIVGIFTIAALSLGMCIGFGWLIYLTIHGALNYCKGKSNLHNNLHEGAVKK